jgi:class 3 adenylate cyclase
MAELRTFVFSDLVGSVDLKGEMPGESDAERDELFVKQILEPHRDRIEQLAADFGGRVVSTAGDGHFLVFDGATSAALWAIAVQRIHIEQPITSPGGSTASVRISLHVGAPQIDPRDPYNFVGKAVDYAARLNDFANGEQIVLSRAAVAILEDAGLNNVQFHLHGKRMLRGIGAVDVYELLYDGRAPQRTRHEPREKSHRDWTTVVPGAAPFSDYAQRLQTALATPTEQTPRELGNYQLGELVGTGGMGDVFRATHKQFGRLRAIKVIKPHLVSSGQRDVVRRFYQEIKAIGALEHPNIVVAIDSSTPSDDTHYLVMEYIQGVSAGDLLDRRGPLSVANACEIARQAALGLDYIHRQGMVHRDIKPSNLMLTLVDPAHVNPGSDSGTSSSGRLPLVKILDLGLALLVGEDHERLTRLDHRAMGTAMYMSPEQWRTTSVDIRSDIYSLGCSLYHLLSGQPPFYASELRPEIAHQKEKVPSIQSSEPIPRPLWNVLRKAMAKNPDDRFATPVEFAEALAPFAAGHNLAKVVEEATRRGPAETRKGLATDTQGASQVETRLAGPRPGSSLTANVRRNVPWLAAAIALLVVGIVAGLWYAGSGGRDDEEVLHVGAKLASERVGREIGNRFRILNQIAAGLEDELAAVAANPGDEILWDGLQSRMEKEKLNHEADAKCESLFVISRQGVQVARAPESVSVGNNYAFRDYFHGRGADLEEGATDVEPITSDNLSAVYVSTSTSQLKVAFSVPIWNGKRGDERQVVGVLAMSVDLGDFRVLDQGELSRDREVLLIDLRPDQIGGTSRRGLILHHHELANLGSADNPPRLAPELLKRIDDMLAAGAGTAGHADHVLRNYPDPLGRSTARHTGAIERVVVPTRDGQTRATEWIVLVQQRAR